MCAYVLVSSKTILQFIFELKKIWCETILIEFDFVMSYNLLSQLCAQTHCHNYVQVGVCTSWIFMDLQI
jgi:hypothetical protein